MNEFSNRMGALAQSVSRDFDATAVDDSAVLIRRAKRGRMVWTGAVGTVSLASAAAVAIGGSAAANGAFKAPDVEPATNLKPLPDVVNDQIPAPQEWSKIDKLTADALAAKIAADKAAAEQAAADKAAADKLAAEKAAKKAAAEKAAKDKSAKDKSKHKKHHSNKSESSKSGAKGGKCGDGKSDDKGEHKGEWKDKDKETESGDDNGGSTTEG